MQNVCGNKQFKEILSYTASSGNLFVMENVLERLKGIMSDAGSQSYQKAIDILPEAALAILIIGIGLIVSTALYFLAVRIMEFFAIDKLAGKTPLQRMLRNVGIHKNVSHFLALLIFWLGVLVTLIFAADVLELGHVSNALAMVTLFIPQMIAALLIVIFGMLLAKFLQVFVEQALMKTQVRFATTAGKVVYIAVIIFVLHLVVVQLGFNLSFITTNVMIIFSSLIFIAGVGTMIATRTIIENAFACYQLKQLLAKGQDVSINGTEGTIQEFTNTGVILKTQSGEVVIPALTFFTSTYSLKREHGHGE